MSQDENTTQVPVIAQDLVDKVAALRALATIHNIMPKALYPLGYDELVRNSLEFVKSLHEQLMEEAIKHPDALMIPDLAAQITARNMPKEQGE